jgi:RNA polymerase sigma factor (sigma-70 family)
MPQPRVQNWPKGWLEQAHPMVVDRVYHRQRRYGVNRGEALDRALEATQEAVVRSAGRSFNDFDNFLAWLTNTARNYLVDMVRKQRCEPLQEHDPPSEKTAEPANDLHDSELLQALADCQQQLTARQRDILRLSEEGLTNEVIAEQLLTPDERTQKARGLAIWRERHGALDQLRGCMEGKGWDEHDRLRGRQVPGHRHA